jgi:hypothetical protein
MALTLLHAGPQIDSAPAGSRALWLRADDLSASLSDTDPVTAWNDRDGNGFNFAQGTGAARPTWNAITTAANDQSTISFAGDDFLERSAALFTDYAFTVFTVAMTTQTTARASLWSIMNSPISNQYAQVELRGATGGDPLQFNVRNILFKGASTTDGPEDGAFFLSTAIATSTTNRVSLLDNGNSGSNTSPVVLSTAGFDVTQIGYNEFAAVRVFWSGDIAEIIAFNRVLSADDLSATNSYIAARYGITLA